MRGMSTTTGKAVEGMEHLAQSIRDILTTRIGSRVMRRDYGSNVMALVDAPMNDGWMIRVMAEVSRSINKWEPRIRVKKVKIGNRTSDGHCTVDIEAILLENGKPILIEGIVV